MKNLKTAFLLGIVFFVFGVITLPHYGVNWDTINHLPRGQAYLHYFLTGRKDYKDLPLYFDDYSKKEQWYWQNPKSLFINTDILREKVPTRSMYQINAADFSYFMQTDNDGHPPLSDILSSAFNRVLFGKLRLINDIDSYRVYSIFLASCLLALVFYWTKKVYGGFAGLIAAVSLGLYPLFFSEMHFNNEKDIPEAVYWSFMMYSVWKGITKKSWKWILVSGLFMGLALGTKFNIVFSIFVIGPWFLYFLVKNNILLRILKFKISRDDIKFLLSIVLAPTIGLVILIGSWPYLWADPITRIGNVIGFYQGIGLAGSIGANFAGPLNTTTYPFQWIIYTTPLIILSLGALGIVIGILKLQKEKDKISLLFLLWILVPIARVTMPGASVYGGIRQIMEYIPGFAILSGLGGTAFRDIVTKFLNSIFKNRGTLNIKIASLVIVLAFVPISLKLISIHPNENVYFNPLIGGLSGAKLKNFPYWGFSFGAAYRQGIIWIDNNAEKGAKVSFAYELIPNIPRIFIRPDIILHNTFRSGYLRSGEYAITLVYQGTAERSYYDTYLEKFLDPVYQVQVDGVAILKVWKNDDAHLKLKWKDELIKNVFVKRTDYGLRFELGDIKKLSRLEATYSQKNCSKITDGYIKISEDGKNWIRLPGDLPDDWRISSLGEQPLNGKYIEPFLGQDAKFIDIFLSPSSTCLKNIQNFKLYTFQIP